ncbi:hypothetical protein [Maribacter thermophilus]|uniref:hypothetical protein n=1 Tax=Maribacter thermophilus TaxID=1197874 RepID=UPI000B03790F|nr:hypothetical protein [Maribacter thermophilus]
MKSPFKRAFCVCYGYLLRQNNGVLVIRVRAGNDFLDPLFIFDSESIIVSL